MPKPRPEVERCAAIYRLAVPERVGRGRAGERLGRGTGSSLEFQDRRSYAVGDDVRHLDWRAFGRTDQLLVRVYREEIAPRVEVLLDASKSMAVDPNKAQLAVDLAALLLRLARADGFHARLVVVGDRSEPAEPAAFDASGIELASSRPLIVGIQESLTWLVPGSMRFLVSDFLSPHDAPSLVRPLAAQAGSLGLLQVVSRDDLAPAIGSALRLTDSETGEILDLVMDSATVEAYATRIRRLVDALETECRRAGGHFLTAPSGSTLEEVCRNRLLPDRWLSIG